MAGLGFGQINLLVDRAEHHQRASLPDQTANFVAFRLLSGLSGHRKGARQAQIALEIGFYAAGIGLGGGDSEAGRRKEVLRDRSPQIPQGLQSCMFFALDEGLGVKSEQLAKAAQELRGAFETNRRLQIGLAENLCQVAAEFAVHHHVHIGIHQVADLAQMGAKGEHHVHLGADPLNQTANLMQIRGHVEGAIHRPQDVDPRLRPFGAQTLARHPAFGHAVFGEKPGHRAVGALPLVFVDGARKEALQVRALRRHAAADHLGNRAGDDDRGQKRIERLPRPAHRALGALAAEFSLAQARDDDRQFMRRQPVGVVQHRGHRQVFAAHRTVDDHLQPLDGAEGVNRAPIAPCPVVIEEKHQIISSALASLAAFSIFLRCCSRKSG